MHVLTVPVTSFMQNTRFITCQSTGKSAVIDPGGDVDKLQSVIAQNKLDVEAILLTHGHLDHVGAADLLKAVLKVDIIGPHQDETFWFEAIPMQAQMFGFKPKQAFLPDRWLTAGDVVKVGKLELEVRFCPGHTPGHVVFYEKSSKTVIVGDVLFKGAIGRTDFPKGNTEQLKESIRKELFSLPDETIVMSGHGENTTIGYEKQNNPFMSGRFG
ncbi:MBL fold metallo-hydrolase [Pseudoalteromonas sp. MMG013]|uniref:MBL fold metallo-hydrolase n=1 Tax=Pseudoalteromonas sp. MMG013 TaxID=2822687 RepID=UPI001B36E064|nr:MBL fold metallo-hydrolase [Pseudoalteromonas sp. MMG013]